MLRAHPYRFFFGSAAIAFIVATSGSEMVVSTVIGTDSLREAITKQLLHFTGLELLGTIQASLPFAAVAWVSVSLTKKRTLRHALALLGAGLVAMIALYFNGYYEAEQLLRQQRWTEAALAVGLLPFESIPLLLLLLAARWLVVRFSPEATLK